jgi:hypothetical protein
MFGSRKRRSTNDDLMGKLRPDLTRESLGVGPDVRYRPAVMDHYVALADDA